ncbi:PREDICTED: uncharacterized protein LOC108554593 [Eufriesea mexicana]|nr:PREDICTED: uncharacterized protein LOC108554593 [Eufriesea mexicana]
MSKQLTLERVINIIWLSVALTFCWPLPANSSKIKTLGYKLLQIVSIISASLLLLPLLYSAYVHTNNVIIAFKCFCLGSVLIQFIIQTIICLINYDSIQYIVEEMMINVKEAKQYERAIFYKYIKKYYTFYGSSMVCMYLTATTFSAGPMFLPNSFPSEAEYSFRVDYTPVRVILYMHQLILSYQCAAHMCISLFGALLFWYTSAKFECLAIELQKITNVRMLVVCLNKQIRLRR